MQPIIIDFKLRAAMCFYKNSWREITITINCRHLLSTACNGSLTTILGPNKMTMIPGK